MTHKVLENFLLFILILIALSFFKIAWSTLIEVERKTVTTVTEYKYLPHPEKEEGATSSVATSSSLRQ